MKYVWLFFLSSMGYVGKRWYESGGPFLLNVQQEINAHGKAVLCRTENYANSHPGLNSLLRGQKLLGLLRQLSGEDMLLFKEKINYKLAGSGTAPLLSPVRLSRFPVHWCRVRSFETAGGFAPHVDSTAYTHIKNIKHLAILLAVDPSDMTNGGLEVVEGSHDMDVPIGNDNCIEPAWVNEQTWTPVELKAGKFP